MPSIRRDQSETGDLTRNFIQSHGAPGTRQETQQHVAQGQASTRGRSTRAATEQGLSDDTTTVGATHGAEHSGHLVPWRAAKTELQSCAARSGARRAKAPTARRALWPLAERAETPCSTVGENVPTSLNGREQGQRQRPGSLSLAPRRSRLASPWEPGAIDVTSLSGGANTRNPKRHVRDG